jgi:hypothetical protein
LAIGEKLFEWKGGTTGVTIKSIGSDGVTTERNIAGEVKGFGRAASISGESMATSTAVGQPSGLFHVSGHALTTTKDGETVAVKISAVSKREGGKVRGVGLSTYMTTSASLSWLNSLVTIDEFEAADIAAREFVFTSYEWK